MEFRFYIFGAPEIFDLYDGNTNDITYFQTFYDGSKENTKLTIHRRINGQVSYSYLRYKMISGSGRTGAFFGMSIVFNDEFCYNIAKLYRLFETVYKDRILQNKILLEEIQGNPDIQAKFLIRTFKEQEIEVRNIENIILKNIKNKFSKNIENKSSDDIRPLDSSFKQGKPNLIRKLNKNKDNDTILNTLRDYSWVSISTEYPETVDEISREKQLEWDTLAKKITAGIFDNYKILNENPGVVHNNISKWEVITNDILRTIEYYLENQPKLEKDKEKFIVIQKELYDQKIIAEKELTKKENSHTTKSKKETKKRSGARNSKKKDNPINKPLIGNIEINKSFLKKTLIPLGIIVIAALLWQIIPWSSSSKNNTDCPECLEYYQNFDKHLSQGKFDLAWNELEKLQKENKDITSQQSSLIDKVKSESDGLKTRNTENDLRDAKKLIEQSVKYGNTNISQDTIDITESIRFLQAQNAFQEKPPKYEFSKKLCTVILESECSDNIKNQAETLLNEVQAKIDETEKKTSVVDNKASSVTSQKQDAENIIIRISLCDASYNIQRAADVNEKFQVGQRLNIVAKQGNSDVTGNNWKLIGNDNGLIEVNDLNKNPLHVKLIKAGSVKLTYKDQSCTLIIRR